VNADRAIRYIYETLGASGFVVLHWRLFVRRPDLVQSGIDAAAAMAEARRWSRLQLPEGAGRFRALMPELGGYVEVWAWSGDRLAERITVTTGLAVESLAQETGGAAPAITAPSMPRPDPAGDRHAGVVTREPGRTCSECENYTAAHACGAAERSGIARPAARTPRRCIAFVPLWDDTDRRDGRRLWPELARAAEVQA